MTLDDMEKRRIILGLAAFFLIYVGAYAYLRSQKTLIHTKTWADKNYHSVTLERDAGRRLFMAAALSGVSQSELQKVSEKHKKKSEVMMIIFKPLMIAESLTWTIIDRERKS